jgi:hypothetical protein
VVVSRLPAPKVSTRWLTFTNAKPAKTVVLIAKTEMTSTTALVDSANLDMSFKLRAFAKNAQTISSVTVLFAKTVSLPVQHAHPKPSAFLAKRARSLLTLLWAFAKHVCKARTLQLELVSPVWTNVMPVSKPTNAPFAQTSTSRFQ